MEGMFWPQLHLYLCLTFYFVTGSVFASCIFSFLFGTRRKTVVRGLNAGSHSGYGNFDLGYFQNSAGQGLAA